MHAILAVGDSLTGGPGVAVGELPGRSWASWLAWCLLAPLADHAVGGATTRMVLADQLPLASGRYRLAVTLLGANDVRLRAPSPPQVFVDVLGGLRARADIVLVATLPLALRSGLSRAPDTSERLQEVRETTVAAARQTGAEVVVFDDLLTGPYEIAPDGLHPSALGQLVLARRAAVALDLLGVRLSRHLPDPADHPPTRLDRLTWPWLRVAHDALYDRSGLLHRG